MSVVAPSEVSIDLAKDRFFEDFALQTLKDRYMVEGETSPQHALARASAAFADDAAHAQRLYNYVSDGWFMFATPLLSNGGTSRGLPISCFLTTAEDSREGILDHQNETAWLSTAGGGVGGYWGEIRSDGEKTSKGSASNGVTPHVAVMDRVILAWSQGETRRGSYAAYLDIEHPEVLEFISGRKPTGGDTNRKFTNLHNAICISDEFMRAVEFGAEFNLRDPKSGRVTASVDARELWRQILETRKQTGEPFLFFKDHANAKLPATQKAKGLRVKQSNLCVAGTTELLTSTGYKPIAALEGQEVEVWNGEAFSKVTVIKTGVEQEIIRVWFEDGDKLDCTPYHKFYTPDGTMIRAGELAEGVRLEQGHHPIIAGGTDVASLDAYYAAGFGRVVGFEDEARSALAVHILNTPKAVRSRLTRTSNDATTDEDFLTLRYESDVAAAGSTPLTASFDARAAYIGGIMDAGGHWIDTDDGMRMLAVSIGDPELTKALRLMALANGWKPRVAYADLGDDLFALPVRAVNELIAMDALLRWNAPFEIGLEADDHPVVAYVQPSPWKVDTYCFSEPLRQRGTFNGYLTGNCTEIMLASGRDDSGKKRTAVCCLSSVNAEMYPEWKNHPLFIEDLMRMLDNCLEEFIQNAPPQLEHAIYSAMQERSVGLGLMGLHALFQRNRVAFESQAARDLNIEIFTHLRAGADAASLKLGAERGEAPDMAGTGERFAHKLAIAPNASSSILCRNTSPATEPFRANAYLQKTLTGSSPVKNRYLVQELTALELDTAEVWKAIIGDEGSVLNLHDCEAVTVVDEKGVEHEESGESLIFTNEAGEECYSVFGKLIPVQVWDEICGIFKTFTELDMRWVVQLARDRQAMIDQGQSVNLGFPSDADAGYINEVHWMAWDPSLPGDPLKSLYYYRTVTPKRAENTNKAIERASVKAVEPAANTMSLNPMDDSTCVACEG